MQITDPQLLQQRRKILIEKTSKGLPFKDPPPALGVKSESVIKIGQEGVEISPNKRKGRPPSILKELDSNEMREFIRKLLRDNKDKVQKWLDDVAEKSPVRALEFYKDLLEFDIPRLQRSENKLDKTPPITVTFQTFNQQTLIEAKANSKQIEQYGHETDD